MAAGTAVPPLATSSGPPAPAPEPGIAPSRPGPRRWALL